MMVSSPRAICGPWYSMQPVGTSSGQPSSIAVLNWWGSRCCSLTLYPLLILTVLIPWISHRFGWWLHPPGDTQRINLIGVGAIVELYVVLVAAFAFFPPALIR